MSMNEEHKRLVTESWKALKEIGREDIGVLLFKNVFTASPESLQFFSFKDEPNLYESEALKKHGAAVINTVGTAVAGLRDIEAMIPALQKLGKKHVGMGITPAHFDVVGAELLRTLGKLIFVFLFKFILKFIEFIKR